MEIAESIELLGSSQTFLGVLATIVILFIFANKDSNFIYLLLSEVKDKISTQVRTLRTNTGVKSVIESHDYKLLTYFLKGDGNKELKEEGTKLLSRIMSERQNLQYIYLPVGNYEDLLGVIQTAREHMLAPLYTVFFCLTVFIYDELLKSPHFGFTNFLLSSLAIFILLSFILWILLWSIFIVNIGYNLAHIEDKNEEKRKKIAKWMAKYDTIIQYINSKSIFITYIIRTLILLICLISVICFFHIFNISSMVAILIMGLILPTILSGVLRTGVRRKKGEYTYLFMCGHYIAMILMAMLFAVIILFFANFWDCTDQMLFSFVDCRWFKVSIFIFVLLNGIFLPFIIPYYTYNRLYWDSKKKVKMSITKSEDLSRELLKELDDFCRKIPV